MLRRAIGVDVLTTFADIKVEDMSDNNTTTTTDDLKKVERTVFNSLGIS
nr:MAG TPA: portal protein [Caudoviricetes sp.]